MLVGLLCDCGVQKGSLAKAQLDQKKVLQSWKGESNYTLLKLGNSQEAFPQKL